MAYGENVIPTRPHPQSPGSRCGACGVPKILAVFKWRGRQPPQIAALPVCPREINSKSLGLTNELSLARRSICHKHVNNESSLCNTERTQPGGYLCGFQRRIRAVPGLASWILRTLY